MKIAESALKKAREDRAGYCTICDAITVDGGVDPDAWGRKCPVCGARTVMGLEPALFNWEQEEQKVTETEEESGQLPRVPSSVWTVERSRVEAQCKVASDRAIRVAKQCGRGRGS